MATRHLEVADIVRRHERDFARACRYPPSGAQRKVLRAVRNCRTAALGGHVDECTDCGHREISYNSCRNRHCPKCQAAARADWLEQRQAELLPVPYFHLVFTLPHELSTIALRNKKLVYGLLFKAAAKTLQQAAEKHLAARIGILAVLHTWGQRLDHHPHVHCIVPGGGLSLDRSTWVSTRESFFLPVRVLSRLFRGKFLHMLKQSHAAGELNFACDPDETGMAPGFRALLNSLYTVPWVVYAKRPFGSPVIVLKYLARYTHRVAISNSRLISLDRGKVIFRWKDYAHGSKQRVMALQATEFIRRFLLHTLPKGFTRIRHYGLFANRGRTETLELCRHLIAANSAALASGDPGESSSSPRLDAEEAASNGSDPAHRCTHCETGIMVTVRVFDAAGHTLRRGRPPDGAQQN